MTQLWRSINIWWGVLSIIMAVTACGPVISNEVRREVRPEITFEALLKDPDRYKDQVVMFSGTILEAVNTPEGTLLTVLQHPTDVYGRPQDTDRSSGRFLAADPRFLDVAIYAPGRAVTVAGTVEGARSLPLGQIHYQYPVLKAKDIYLWRPRPMVTFGLGFSSQFFDGRTPDPWVMSPTWNR